MPFSKRALLATKTILFASASIVAGAAFAQNAPPTGITTSPTQQMQDQLRGKQVGVQQEAQPALTQPAPVLAAPPGVASAPQPVPVLTAAPVASTVPPAALSIAPTTDALWLAERRKLARDAMRQELLAKADPSKSGSGGGDGKFSLPPLPAGAQLASTATTAPASTVAPPPELHIVGVSVPDEGKPVVMLLIGGATQARFTVGDTLPDGSVLVGADLDHLVVRHKGDKKVTSIKTE